MRLWVLAGWSDYEKDEEGAVTEGTNGGEEDETRRKERTGME